MRALLMAGTALVLLSPAAWAQSGTSTNPPATTNPTSSGSMAGQHHEGMRADLTQMLQKSGYTDIRVQPESFFVHAKDSNGNPVVMTVSPDSFTEVTTVGTNGAGDNVRTASNAHRSNSEYVSVPSNDELSSKVVGLDVYNNNNQDIGQIKDIALDPQGETSAYIVSVGGFLGIGEHYVAVNPSAITVNYNDSNKKWHASMNATSDQLKAAPEFKYTGHWASRT